MNWDWDKLQEKRRHQPGGLDGKGKKTQEDKNSRNHDNDPYNDDQDREDKNLFGFGGGGGNNNNPFGGRKSPREMMSKINMPGAKWIVLALVLLWLASGIFIVSPGRAGVILLFGEYNRTVLPGLHYHLPFPIESVALPNVEQTRSITVGQSISTLQQGRGGNSNDDEASMLTGDENIISIKFIITYKIKREKVVDYLYKIEKPSDAVKKAAEAAMREVIGKTLLDDALTTKRNQIQQDVKILLQATLDSYNAGIEVINVQMQDVQPPVEVRDAFKDVASAREDKERLTNEAEAYRSDILPKAQGAAAERINQAEAYKQTRIRYAEGEASRFNSLLAEYNKAKGITKKRLLLETMEKILNQPGIDKVVLPAGMNNQVLPFLPLGPNTGMNNQIPKQPMSTQQNNSLALDSQALSTSNNLQSRSTVRGGR